MPHGWDFFDSVIKKFVDDRVDLVKAKKNITKKA
jgi:hypothetical protein